MAMSSILEAVIAKNLPNHTPNQTDFIVRDIFRQAFFDGLQCLSANFFYCLSNDVLIFLRYYTANFNVNTAVDQFGYMIDDSTYCNPFYFRNFIDSFAFLEHTMGILLWMYFVRLFKRFSKTYRCFDFIWCDSML